MSRMETWLAKVREQINIFREGKTLAVDLGEIPMIGASVLIFPLSSEIWRQLEAVNNKLWTKKIL